MPRMQPGEGERRAVGGYHSQYRACAPLILSSLLEGDLRWIRVADPDAGRVDDLQIGRSNRVDAYQVKWARYGGTFSFNDLLTARDDAPKLIAQLADGWKLLRQIYPSRRIVVHLVTNQMPSVSDLKIPAGTPPPAARHFAAFLEQAWTPARSSAGPVAPPEAWERAWEALRSASGLSEAEFEDFVRDCELDFGYRLPDVGAADDREAATFRQDLRHISHSLFDAVADTQQILQLDRDQLLVRLGWAERFEPRNVHEFPVDELLYRPVGSTVRQLRATINDLPGGYVGVFGTPGSGKSTMLTQTLRFHPARVIRYYAFVPDDRGPTMLRGESTNFLHDVTITLSDAGFGVGKSPNPTDRAQLLSRFHEQLRLLGEDYRRKGQKTLILVDGLDHIEREQHPDRSLLRDLPAPEQVPEGVYIVLGSQTDMPFPSGVQYEVRRPERRVEMSPLSREAVAEIVVRAGLSESLNEEQQERVHYLSDGHPLALMYLLGRLQNRASAESVDTVLKDTMRYEGSIERQYHGYWRQIEDDHRMVNLLGLLARFRNVIDMRWVEGWDDGSPTRTLRLTMAHYFRVEDRHRWYFFHNSFRLYLLHKTAETLPESFDHSLDRGYHRQLAERCAQEPEGSYQAWEELYHRFMAGENARVLELANQDRFREQFRSFRPARAVKEDIRLALRSAAALREVASIPRLILSGYELEQREYYVEPPTLAELLLQIGEGQMASEYLRDGRLLLVDKDEGLRLSIMLRSAGYTEEGRRLFELAEPLDLLAEGSSVKDELARDEWDLLEGWAEAAVHFLSIDELLGAAGRVRVESAGAEWLIAEEATGRLRSRMLFGAGLELLKQRRWEDLHRVCEALHAEAAEELSWWFRLNARVWRERATDPHTARRFLERTVEEADSIDLGPEARVVLAEGLYRIMGDGEGARRFLSDVPQPDLAAWTPRSYSGLGPFLQRFRLNRLLFALDGQRPAEDEIIPDAQDPRNQAVVYFERALCRLARLWGAAWRGITLDPSALVEEIRPLLRLPLWRDRSPWSSSARLLVGPEARSELYSLTVDTAAQHGPQAVQRLRNAFEKEWDGDAGAYWPNGVRREVIMALWRAGTNKGWTLNRLRELEGRTTDDNDVGSRIDERREQVEALSELGEEELARSSLRSMLSVSLGVGYEKDYQLDTWIRWLGQVNALEPERCAERIAWFSRAILALQAESTAHSDAANELLEVCFRWSPRRAVALLWWFSEKGVVQHEEAIRALLRAALDAEDPPTDAIARCLGDIVIPIANRADSELAALSVERVARCRGREGAVEAARTLSHKISAYARPSERSGWLYGVAQALERLGVDPVREAGFAQEDTRRENEDSYSSTLELDGEPDPLSVEEVERRASSPSGLRRLLEQHTSDSYYQWELLLEPLLPSLRAEQVRELAPLFRGRRHGSLALSMLSKRLHDLGNVEGAWSLGQQALQTSDALLGWRRWGDGGSRLSSLGALVRVDADRARPLALRTLVGDLADGSLYFQSIALNLETVLPLMTSDVPVLGTWREVEGYLGALFEGSVLPSDRPEFLEGETPNDTARTAISDLITSHLDHPVNVLSEAALRACGNWLLEGDDGVGDAIRRLLEGSEVDQERALMVLDAASLREPQVAAPFRDELRGLLTSPNHAAREMSRAVCERLGLRLPLPTALPSAPLPAVYRLSLPPNEFRLYAPSAEVSETAALPDAWDSIELVRPFDFQLGFVAEEAGLPEENTCHRAAQFMRQQASDAQLTAQYETEFRANLSEVGLRFPNRRPRATLARRAMSKVVAELADAGRLRAGDLRRLEGVLRFYDPFMLLVHPAPRPEYVLPMSTGERSASQNEAWVERVEEALDLAAKRTSDGRIVLAEETTLKKLDWGSPIEGRWSAVLPLSGTSRSGGDQDALFHKAVNKLYTEFPDSASAADRLVARHLGYGYESPGERWLALNPSVGRQLGWTPTDTGLFGWANDEGETMVESVWWADGLLARTHPLGDYAVGEGWLVLATEEALARISEAYGALARVLVAERSWTNEEREKLSASVRREENL